MLILRGRLAGKSVRCTGYANSWINVDHGGRGAILGPTCVQLDDPDEFDMFDGTNPHVGSFFQVWELTEDGTFRRRPRGETPC